MARSDAGSASTGLGRWRAYHALVALAGLALCGVLAFSTGGHPPGFVLIPLVLLLWAVAHLFGWGAHRLMLAGNRVPPTIAAPTVTVLAIVSAVTAFASAALALLQRILDGALEADARWMLALGLVAGVSAVGLLRRTHWGRLLTGACYALGALWLIARVVSHLRAGGAVEVGALAVVIVAILVALALAYWLIVSAHARARFGDGV